MPDPTETTTAGDESPPTPEEIAAWRADAAELPTVRDELEAAIASISKLEAELDKAQAKLDKAAAAKEKGRKRSGDAASQLCDELRKLGMKVDAKTHAKIALAIDRLRS